MKEKNRIFISWSGENGKQIARMLKKNLEFIFLANSVKCFVSSTDIKTGEEWWNVIKKQLKSARIGIICITKESVKEPWIHYESGALVANNARVIPLLFNCGIEVLCNTPLDCLQAVKFHDCSQFVKIIVEICEKLINICISTDEIEKRAKECHATLKKELEEVFDR